MEGQALDHWFFAKVFNMLVLKRGIERVAYNVKVIFLFQEPGKPQFYHVLPGTSKIYSDDVWV